MESQVLAIVIITKIIKQEETASSFEISLLNRLASIKTAFATYWEVVPYSEKEPAAVITIVIPNLLLIIG